MSSLKELTAFIKKEVINRFYGRGDNPAQMRDITYKKSEAYRGLVQEPGVADLLRIDGEITHWQRAKNAKRTSQDDNQFDFGLLPNAPVEFNHLKRKNYIPASDESEEGEEGMHLEPENMTRPQMISSGEFYQRSGSETIRRGEILLALAKYHTAMRIPSGITIKQWRDDKYGKPA